MHLRIQGSLEILLKTERSLVYSIQERQGPFLKTFLDPSPKADRVARKIKQKATGVLTH